MTVVRAVGRRDRSGSPAQVALEETNPIPRRSFNDGAVLPEDAPELELGSARAARLILDDPEDPGNAYPTPDIRKVRDDAATALADEEAKDQGARDFGGHRGQDPGTAEVLAVVSQASESV